MTERIAELRAILGDETRVLAVIKEELTEIAERFGDARRTEISHSEDEIDIEDLIADQQMVITITQSGYIKSLPLATYRQQQRGGRGVTGMDMKDGDFIEHLFVTSSHDYLLFFSNRGKVYRSKVYELPEAQRTAKGRALVNILPLREGERIQAVVSTRDFSETKYLVFATRNGTVKKTELAAYNTPIKADGIIAINIRDDDELLAVRAVDPDDEIIMVSRAGLTVRFAESDVRAMGRDTTGVRGMDVGEKGRVIAMDVARDDMDLLVVTENGYGKRTQVSQYRKTNRGAKGVKTIGLTEQKGALAGALVVREHQELVFISVGGMVQRTGAAGISQQGRSATGVRVMNLKDEDVVSAVALVVDTGEEIRGRLTGQPTAPLSRRLHAADGVEDRCGGRTPAAAESLGCTAAARLRPGLPPVFRAPARRQRFALLLATCASRPGVRMTSKPAPSRSSSPSSVLAGPLSASPRRRRKRDTTAPPARRRPPRGSPRERAVPARPALARAVKARERAERQQDPLARLPASSTAATIADVLATPCQNTEITPRNRQHRRSRGRPCCA